MSKASARIAYVNLFAADPQRLADFYSRLFGFAEIEAHRSPIYRCLDANGIELGFNAHAAYDLLGIPDRKGEDSTAVRAYFTIEVDAPEAVNAIAASATAEGGCVIKQPYDTYYNARQAVLEDPEGNVFRVNYRMGPRTPWDEIERSGAAPFKLPTS
jgi:predicted enzyme related to lactoylglutathione lyase